MKVLREGNINPNKILKDQINFKPDISEIKKGNPKSKSKDQISVTRNVETIFKDCFFLLSEAKYKANHGSVLKILTSKQMHQIAFAHLKAGNTSKNLLTEIRQIIYSLYRAKEITKKLHNNVMKSIKLKKMDTIFMNSENCKTSDPHRLLLLNVT